MGRGGGQRCGKGSVAFRSMYLVRKSREKRRKGEGALQRVGENDMWLDFLGTRQEEGEKNHMK